MTDTRLHGLDILRGFMALSVAVYHFSIWTNLVEGGTRANVAVAVLGNYAVEGFFVVSGFCFFYLYGQSRWGVPELKAFHGKRFFRIAPLYFLAVALNLLLRQPVGPELTPRMLAENLTLTFGLFHPNHALVLGGWSIGIEYVFYLVFPILAWATRRRWILYLGTALFLALAIPWTFFMVPAAPHAGDLKFHTYVQIPNHAFLFLCGGVLADLRGRIRTRLPFVAFLVLTFAILGYAIFSGPAFYDHFEVMAGMARVKYVGLCLLLVGVFAFHDLPEHPVRRPFQFLGEASYSIYLLHPFVWLAVKTLIPVEAWPVTAFLLALSFTLATAGLVYRWVERPAMAYGRRLV